MFGFVVSAVAAAFYTYLYVRFTAGFFYVDPDLKTSE